MLMALPISSPSPWFPYAERRGRPVVAAGFCRGSDASMRCLASHEMLLSPEAELKEFGGVGKTMG